MALFSRRILKNCLDDCASSSSAGKLRDWVQRLNTVSGNYVATEWELVLLRAFGALGKVRHEPPLGRRSIDLVFESLDGMLKFGADIAAISDQPLHKRNPIYPLWDELRRRIRKANISTGRFTLRVEEERPVPYRGTEKKRRLLLPTIRQSPDLVFNAAYNDFIDEIRKSPYQPRSHHVFHFSPATIDLTIQYEPGAWKGVTLASHGSYTTTTVKDNNPLFNALKSKADQLRQSGYKGIRGIIVCDAGCRIFTEIPNWSTYKMDEVVTEFFRQNDSVEFVLTIGIISNFKMSGVQHEYAHRLFARDRKSDWVLGLKRLSDKVVSSLPSIAQTPENVLNIMKWNQSAKWTRPYMGGSIVKGNEIRISCRELLDVLAGRLDQGSFAQNHDLGGGNIFAIWRSQGKMINRAEVEHRPDEDDDWITLEFKKGDPAVCDFTVPTKVRE